MSEELFEFFKRNVGKKYSSHDIIQLSDFGEIGINKQTIFKNLKHLVKGDYIKSVDAIITITRKLSEGKVSKMKRDSKVYWYEKE